MTKLSLLILYVLLSTSYQIDSLDKEFSNYEEERVQLNIPRYGYNYLENFANIAPIDHLVLFKKFYEKYDSVFKKFDRSNISINDKINLDHIQYIISLPTKKINTRSEFQSSKTIPSQTRDCI
jgi:hypothetical protein